MITAGMNANPVPNPTANQSPARHGRFRLGMADLGKLSYTAPNPHDEDGVWVIDADRTPLSLRDYLTAHPCALPGPLVDHVHASEPLSADVVSQARGRWRVTGVNKFLSRTNPVKPSDSLRRVQAFCGRFYLTTNSANLTILATFILATYVTEVATTVPYLAIIGEPDSGKTTLGEILERLAFNARLCAAITAAAFYGLRDLCASTVLLDEFLGGSEHRLAVIRSAFRQSGTVTLCEGGVPVERRTFGPLVFLGTNEMTDWALESRNIDITNEATIQRPERLNTRSVDAEAAEIRDELYAFGLDCAAQITTEYQALPVVPGVTNRDEDLWALLWAVARVVDTDAGTTRTYDKLVAAAINAAQKRALGKTLDGEAQNLARAVVDFVNDTANKDQTNEPTGKWFLADAFKDYANHLEIFRRPLRTKEVGQRLNRLKLVKERKVVTVSLAPKLKAQGVRRQLRAYTFDIQRAEMIGGTVQQFSGMVQ